MFREEFDISFVHSYAKFSCKQDKISNCYSIVFHGRHLCFGIAAYIRLILIALFFYVESWIAIFVTQCSLRIPSYIPQ